MLNNSRAQGTIEYLVIIAIVVVIALVVVSILTGFVGQAPLVSEKESKLYWQSQELAVTDLVVDSEGDGKIVIKSNIDQPITITSATIGGIDVNLASGQNGNISLGQDIVLHGENLPLCVGQATSYDIIISYTTKYGVNKKLFGTTPYTSTCSDIDALTIPLSVSLTSPSHGANVNSYDVDLTFDVRGTDANYCELISPQITSQNGDQNTIIIENGSKTFSLTGLTGGGTIYAWDVNCSNANGEWVNAGEQTFTIPNIAPYIQFVSPTSGTQTGSVTIDFNVFDLDNAGDLNATFYYSTSPGVFSDQNYIGDLNLNETCFTSGNISTQKTCRYTWQITDPDFNGDYYIDINLTDGTDSNTTNSSQLAITNCTSLTGLTAPIAFSVLDTDLDGNVNLCSGTYAIEGTTTGVINMNQSGTSNENRKILNCNGATLTGSLNYGVYVNGNYNTIKNCNILNYATSVRVNIRSYLQVLNSNLSRETTKTGYGIYFYHNQNDHTYDTTIQNSTITNRAAGIYFWEESTSGGALSYVRNYHILDNNLSNNTDGLGHSARQMYFADGMDINGNDFINNTGWAVNLDRLSNARVGIDNNYQNSANALMLASNHNFNEDYNFKQFNITTTILDLASNNKITNINLSGIASLPIVLRGSHNLVQDVNLTRTIGTKSGYGVRFETNQSDYPIDNNVINCEINNRSVGIHLYEIQTSTAYTSYPKYDNFLNNVIQNNTSGIGYGNRLYFEYFNISGNQLTNNTTAINLDVSNRTTIGTDNNFNGSPTAIVLGSYNDFNGNYNFNQNTIATTILSLASYNNIANLDLNGTSSTPLILRGSYNTVENVDLNGTSSSSITVNGSHNLIQNVNVSRNGTKSGNGINFSGNSLVDNNILNSTCANRVNCIISSTPNTCSTQSDYLIQDNNFTNSTNALYTGGNAAILRFNINNNRFVNISGWAANLSAYQCNYNNQITISQENVMENVANAISIGNYYTIENRDFSSWDVTGTLLQLMKNNTISNVNLSGNNNIALDLLGSSNLVSDVNIVKIGTKGGTGIRFYGNVLIDNNVLNSTCDNRATCINTTTPNTCSTQSNFLIQDNNFTNSGYGIGVGGNASLRNFKIIHNNFINNSTNGALLYNYNCNATGNHTINQNNFISNTTNITSATNNDANYNYWSNFSCIDTTPADGTCDTTYSFTGGADYSPLASPIN
ncbi:MAG: hypothetical protein WC915_02395 [archaeon]|jgi:hypothetical protein